MGDDITASIKRTQDSLGKYVKKPPLSDKNLTRPPFRFLHDLVHNVIDTTGFMSGVFTPEELDVANVTSREAKSAFMQKVIEAVKEKTGEDVPIKVSKILAGLEAEKTNNLLQSLAKAIESHQQESGGGSKKGSGGKKPAAPAGQKGKPDPKSKPDAKKPAAAATKASDKKDGGSGGTKRTIRDPSPGSKPAAKQGKTQDAPGSGGKGKPKPVKPSPAVAAPPPPEPSVPESQVNDETVGGDVGNVEEEVAPQQHQRVATARKLQRKESNADMAKPKVDTEEDVDLDALNANGAKDNVSSALTNGNVSNNFDPISSTLLPSPTHPNMQTLPPPTTPILTDADAVNATMMTPPPPVTPIKSASLTPTPGPSLTPSPSPMLGLGAKPRTLSREPSAASIGEVRPPTGQQVRSRPDTGTGGRLTSARPPSARRAPPRPKSSVVREDPEAYRPQTGKVAHVILDNAEDPEDDDDNYVVREVTVGQGGSKAPGLSDLDETPELGGGSAGILGGSEMELGLDGEKGLLVHQILETQKELEDKAGGAKGEEGKMEKKLKELSLAEIDKLKNLIQVCSRSANPLAKLLDYMAEDVDAMQKEYNQYREESKRLSLELEKSKEETEKFLGSLKHELQDLERKIKDKEDGILASQMKIIQQEERLEEIVLGFERVRSGKGGQVKEHMPSAEDILAHIQGQGQQAPGGGAAVYGGTGGTGFSFVGGGSSSTPSSAGGDGFRIPEAFMASGGGSGGGDQGPSPFSRGRMWQGMGGGAGSATFDLPGDDDEDTMGSMGRAQQVGGRRSVGRSGGVGVGGSFRRSATVMDYSGGEGGPPQQAGMAMDVDSFNPWS